ncbi:MAG: polysaccharide biosynthesis protein [Cytophagales bacterium]|nr:MAG: polysaccharide biosynthesis protein [Cytophagales bacterium]TAF60579.1 MAG: polysaccharide biosynthesis protein [Cytophagales bacterium]
MTRFSTSTNIKTNFDYTQQVAFALGFLKDLLFSVKEINFAQILEIFHVHKSFVLKKLLSDTALYGLSSVLGRLLNYLLVPLHTGVLATSSYGVVSKFYAYAAFFNVLYTFGMETAFFRFSADKMQDKQEVFNVSFTVILVISLLSSGLLYVLAVPVAGWIGDASQAQFVRWFAGIFFIDAIVIVPFARLRMENRAKKFATVRLINIVMNVILNYLVLYFFHQAVTGEGFESISVFAARFYSPADAMSYVFLINLIANAFVLPLLIPELKNYVPKFRFELLKKMLRYGYPIVLMGLFFCINEVGNRNFLEWWLPEGYYADANSLDAVGIFSACYKLSIFISLAVQAFKYAAEPFFFGKAADKNSPKVFAVVMRYFVIACTLMFLGVSLNLDTLQYFLRQESYRAAMDLVPILLMANVFLGIYYNLAVCFKLTDKTIYGAYLGGLGAIITLLGNYSLIPLLGYWGCAWSTLACYAFMCVACYWWGEKYFPVPYFLKSALSVMFLAAVVVWATTWIEIADVYMKFGVMNGLFLTFSAIIVFYERKQFTRIQASMRT